MLKWGTSNKEQVSEHGGRKWVPVLDLESFRCLQDIQEWIAVYMHLELRRPEKKERRVKGRILRSNT